jgi:hypothetical protein
MVSAQWEEALSLLRECYRGYLLVVHGIAVIDILNDALTLRPCPYAFGHSRGKGTFQRTIKKRSVVYQDMQHGCIGDQHGLIYETRWRDA